MRKIYQKSCKILLIAIAIFTVQIGHTGPINTAVNDWKCTLQWRGGPGVAGYYAITPNIDLSTGFLHHLGVFLCCPGSGYRYCGYKKNNDVSGTGYISKFVKTYNLTIPLIVRFHGQGKGNLGLNIGLNFDFVISGDVRDGETINQENCPNIKPNDCLSRCAITNIKKTKLSEINDKSMAIMSILVGLDYEFEGGFNFGIEYLHGLNSVIPLDKTYDNFSINLTFGYNLIPLFTG